MLPYSRHPVLDVEVLEEAWKLGQMSAEDYHRAIAIERKTGQRLLKGRALSIGEVQTLFDVCAQDKSVKGSRDAALIAVLYGAGLRRSEVVTMNLADWNPNDNCLTVRSGKRDKDRTTYLDDGAAAALADWLIWRGDEPGALFYPTRKGGKLEARQMTDQAVLDILQQRGRRQTLHRSHHMTFGAHLSVICWIEGQILARCRN